MQKKSSIAEQVKRVTFHLIESDDFLDHYAIHHTWSPLVAACLICGYKPGELKDYEFHVHVVSEGAVTKKAIESFDCIDVVRADELLNIAESITQRWPDCDPVAEEVIQWALRKGLIADSPFARSVLGTVPERALREKIEALREEVDRLDQCTLLCHSGFLARIE